ncbi:MAG TPA: inositol-3-phosphate synthase [Thermodesulfobacteriota bacterium]|nr:inositol-3-phosphate synthase [Thermodesulfobacteriota bacterium]
MTPDTSPRRPPRPIAPAEGRLGVLLVGLGAVSTTVIAGVDLIARGLARPVGSLTQMQRIRLGRRDEGRNPLIKEFVPLAEPKDLVFGAWDPFPDDGYEAARKAGVLPPDLLEAARPALAAVKPMPAVFDRRYVRNLDGPHVKRGRSSYELAEALVDDIERFRRERQVSRLVMIWCGSTEAYLEPGPVHATVESLERGLRDSDPAIPPSMIYAYAAVRCGIPFANGAPNLAVDVPALVELAKRTGAPIAGKDLKTGQTLMKTVIAPALKARMLGLTGWYSTNILGNRDGEVLDDPESFRAKAVTKTSVLDTILQPDLYPDLYGRYYHKVRIDYYPPRGDAKEGWDNIDIVGWLGLPMQIKINFLCRDSILAAPVVLDLILFLDLAKRAGMKGIQEWLSFYFKSPMTAPGLYPEHDLFIQHTKLKNTLRYLMGEAMITHLGLDYYDYYEDGRG